jgi:hypothetical protein
MQNYKVWLRARDPKTLEVVATVRIFNAEDRLAAERVAETAQARLQLLVLQLLHVHPGAIVSTEMEMLGTALRAVHDNAERGWREFWINGRRAHRVTREAVLDAKYMSALLEVKPDLRAYPNAGEWRPGQVVGDREAMAIEYRCEVRK